MTAASLNELKQKLQTLSQKELIELSLRLIKYKKENKELTTYLLFEFHDQEAFTSQIKEDMNELFKSINLNNQHLAKKTIRKILRRANKYVKYTNNKQIQVEVFIHFCSLLKLSGIQIHKSKAILNIYEQQLKKINVALSSLHEDIQYDFIKQLNSISSIK